VRSGSSWSQQAYIKASNTDREDYFGASLSLSADGSTLAVGAYGEDSSATGINGEQSDNSGGGGAAYVFVRSGSDWSQQAYIKASNTDSYYWFGLSVSLSADGSTLAVGDCQEYGIFTGVNGEEGAVYVFVRSGSIWSQQAYIKASNKDSYDWFGSSVSLSADGSTLAVGAYGEDSNATGINGEQSDNSAEKSGAVYVFVRSGSIWSQQAYTKAYNTDGGDLFGFSVSLSSDGRTLAVGAHVEGSSATGINGDQSDNIAEVAGAVYVFVK
jgi:hypothetical protein